MKTISLYSGAGGLDCGFAKQGFNTVWANDFDKDSCETYKSNLGDHIQCGDIDKYEDDLIQYKNKIALIIGGPPCQGFSIAGKMDPNDPRSKHIWKFADIVKMIMPRAFVLENVKALGVLNKWAPIRGKLLDVFRSYGYSTNFVVLNASEFNVPQNRERVFFIGFKNNSSIIPDLQKMMEDYKITSPTVREILNKIAKPGNGNNQLLCNAKITITPKPILRKSPYAGMLFNGLGRPIRLDGYCSTLPATMGGNKTPIIDDLELENFSENWVVSYHRKLMNGEKPLPYSVAPSRLRRLTVLEASAIQTFPSSYKFIGSKSSIYKQIGNAVPCNLAYSIAKMVMNVLLQDDINNMLFPIDNQLNIYEGI